MHCGQYSIITGWPCRRNLLHSKAINNTRKLLQQPLHKCFATLKLDLCWHFWTPKKPPDSGHQRAVLPALFHELLTQPPQDVPLVEVVKCRVCSGGPLGILAVNVLKVHRATARISLPTAVVTSLTSMGAVPIQTAHVTPASVADRASDVSAILIFTASEATLRARLSTTITNHLLNAGLELTEGRALQKMRLALSCISASLVADHTIVLLAIWTFEEDVPH